MPQDRQGQNFDSLSRPIPEYPGTATGQKEKKSKKITILEKKKKKILTSFENFLSRDVPGQRSLLRDFCCCSCPGTKGQRDKETFFVPGQRTARQGNFFVTGQRDNGTSRSLETLIHMDFPLKRIPILIGF